jgi:hypothetical protein
VSAIFSNSPPLEYWIFFSALALMAITLAITVREGAGNRPQPHRHEGIGHTVGAGWHILQHTAILALLTACMIFLSWAIENNPLQPHPIMFGFLPLTYLIEAAELIVLVSFGYRSFSSSNEAFKGGG